MSGCLAFGLLTLSVTASQAAFLGLLSGDQGNGEISIINGDGTYGGPFVPNAGVNGGVLNNPHGVAVATNGDVYTGDFGSNPQAMKQFSPGGTLLTTTSLAPFSTSINGFQVQALVFGPGASPLLYFDSGTGTQTGGQTADSIVYTLTTGTNAITPLTLSGVVGGSTFGATGLAFDSAGHLYVASSAQNLVDEFTLSGSTATLLRTFSTGVSGPTGLAINDAAGILYVANGTTDTISKFNITTGATAGTISTLAGMGAGIGGLSFDPASGRLYVGGDLSEKVFALVASTGALDTSFNGTGSVTIPGGSGIYAFPQPFYLTTFAGAVPEPSSVALMGLGLVGVVGVAVKKGRGASA